MNTVTSLRINNHLFVASSEKAVSNLVRRECLTPVSGVAWCAVIEVDDKYLFSATISEEKPAPIFTGQGCEEIHWASIRSDFGVHNAGTVRSEDLVLDGLTHFFQLNNK